MPRRLTNDLLLVLVISQVATGVFGWSLPSAAAGPLYDLHRIVGLGIVGLLIWKYGIARRSLERRLGHDGSIVWGLLAALGLLVTLGLGLAWTLNLVSFSTFWGYSALNVHTALGIAMLAILLPHALQRLRFNRSPIWRKRAVTARRSMLRQAAGLLVAGILGGLAIDRLANLLVPARRESGSKHAASFSANQYPEEIWLLDQVPLLDPATWRLALGGKLMLPAELSLADLAAMPQHDLQAVLDCTGGWWTEQVWSGPRLGDVLARSGLDPTATEGVITSVTGHQIVLPLDELIDAVLAVRVGGEALTPGHGYPLRLAVPGRRGFHWVKWISTIEVR